MANHKSAIKRTRSDYTKNQHNKYIHKTTRNAIKKLQTGEVPVNAAELSKVFSLIDKLVKGNVIHKNKAANLKSKLSKLNINSSTAQDIENNKKAKKVKISVKKTKSPVEETPVEKTPVVETPVEETPVVETPVEETPVEETPVEETPVEETPIEGTPVEKAPIEDKAINTDSTEKE